MGKRYETGTPDQVLAMMAILACRYERDLIDSMNGNDPEERERCEARIRDFRRKGGLGDDDY